MKRIKRNYLQAMHAVYIYVFLTKQDTRNQVILKKSRKPETFVRKGGYPGGSKAMGEFIRANLRYPEDALKNNIEGMVVVEVDYNESGKVSATRVIKGLGYGCDEEAVRVARLLRFNKTSNKGMRVTFHQKINIQFRLPAPAKVGGYTYHVTFKQHQGTSYTYSIPARPETDDE